MLSRQTIGGSKVLVRAKSSKVAGQVNPATQRVVNQLSVLSATKKQPKVLNLCKEDLVKHRTITNAWNIFQRKQADKRAEQLSKQYDSIKAAMDELKLVSPQLYQAAREQKQQFFPIDMRLPTDFPPTKPWVYNYAKDNNKL